MVPQLWAGDVGAGGSNLIQVVRSLCWLKATWGARVKNKGKLCWDRGSEMLFNRPGKCEKWMSCTRWQNVLAIRWNGVGDIGVAANRPGIKPNLKYTPNLQEPDREVSVKSWRESATV